MNQESSAPILEPQRANSLPQSATQSRVLVADDDIHIRKLLELSLQSDGYSVLSAADGHELVQLAQQYVPNLILVDLMMPHMDGYEAIRQMRNDTRIAHIPMLILTARLRPDEIVIGFETGADDYIAKPFNIPEVLARVRSHLRRAARQPAVNPLSGLPGGMPIKQELESRFEPGQPLALLHADLDNFKTFNDTYGFSRGDRAIMLVAQLLQEAVAAYGDSDDFIGHVGGDDFVVLTSPDRIEQICMKVVASFDQEVRQFYKPDEWQRVYIRGEDRFGILRRFNLLTLSIGGTSNQYRQFENADEMARVAAEMKQYTKRQVGSTFAIDQRVVLEQRPLERRSARLRRILIVSEDASLRAVLQTIADGLGYTIQEANSVSAAQAIVMHTMPVLVILDAQLGDQANALCHDLVHAEAPPQILVLTHSGSPTFAGAHQNVVILQIPIPLTDVAVCIEQLVVRQ